MLELILWEWLSFAVRWVHVIAGIAWIGSSFYFVHLDLSLVKREGLPAGAHGEAWQVHGGGFYNMVKYLVAPARMPEHLTWFKWEAYATWLSGMGLLVVVYYFASRLYLIDQSVMALSPMQAIAISVGGLVLGWIVYDGLCKSPLGRNDTTLALVGYVFLVALAWGFTKVFSGRGAYMQMGALIGTIMVANVAMVIIPNQRRVVADLIAGKSPDPRLGAIGKQRSLHNNYLTLPVVFVMISNHYPLSFASRFNWLILALVMIIGAVIRHFYNRRHKGLPSPWWTWGVSAVCGIAIIWLSTFPAVSIKRAAGIVTFAQAEELVISRCSMCHAAQPVWEGIGSAPKGVMLDTPERIKAHVGQIWLNSVQTHAMPPGNITELSAEERGVLAAWIETRP
ncbi:MAG: urate hydroxylase PuuD [Hyphomicrobiaceae bacterium]